MRKYVCIDIGGTAIKYGIIDENGNVLERGKEKTMAHLGGKRIVERAMELVRQYQREYILSGICISTAGMVDCEKGEVIYSAPLIPEYMGTQWKKEMEAMFHLPCEVENDVNCAGLAESISGAAKGSKVTLCLTIGTGIGGCILIGHRVFHGFSNSACEVGYMHMGDSDFQTLGATSGLCKKVALEKGESLKDWDGFRIFEEAKAGDLVCVKAIEEMSDVLGRGIAGICYVLNPQMVVLGGGIMEQEEYLKPRIRRALDKYLISDIAKKTELRMAEHKNDAGMVGAFYHFLICQGKSKW